MVVSFTFLSFVDSLVVYYFIPFPVVRLVFFRSRNRRPAIIETYGVYLDGRGTCGFWDRRNGILLTQAKKNFFPPSITMASIFDRFLFFVNISWFLFVIFYFSNPLHYDIFISYYTFKMQFGYLYVCFQSELLKPFTFTTVGTRFYATILKVSLLLENQSAIAIYRIMRTLLSHLTFKLTSLI